MQLLVKIMEQAPDALQARSAPAHFCLLKIHRLARNRRFSAGISAGFSAFANQIAHRFAFNVDIHASARRGGYIDTVLAGHRVVSG